MCPTLQSDSPLHTEYEPLPSSVWSLGVHDAHCHPTDTMATTHAIPAMKASGIIVMGTRISDQPLVAELSTKYGVYDPKVPEENRGKVIPSFGYHPWFSYLIWDDSREDLQKLSVEDRKAAHYQRALTSNPPNELIAGLPEPKKLSEVMSELRGNLERFPMALVGEIGLDRGFRIPFPNDELHEPAQVNHDDEEQDGKRLSPHKISMEHQKRVFVAQLKLAGELQRAVSVHGVQCHGALFDTFRELWKGHELIVESRKEMKRRRRKGQDGHQYLPDFGDDEEDSSDNNEDEDDEFAGEGDEDYAWLRPKKSQPAPRTTSQKPFPPRVCLHSFSAPPQTLQQYLTPPSAKHRYPSQVYFSFSTTINARPVKGHVGKIMETISGAPEDRVLVESDLHTAGEDMDKALEGAVRLIAGVRGLQLVDCARKLSDNWKEFVFGPSDNNGVVSRN
ncbi:uncharacterized protein H6S33_009190 [Morchella sextelata]|uniref:uncharacterized protein n=1 Tax=Morchella sextelata TaxID=1174677 RepID=UPI001D04C703|nr:uncharacterized protein H6S33_009190 [Morchella sextelata]KAH0612810.1 hypothetical protein H6S33_009190 [Morchella sextelata]